MSLKGVVHYNDTETTKNGSDGEDHKKDFRHASRSEQTWSTRKSPQAMDEKRGNIELWPTAICEKVDW